MANLGPFHITGNPFSIDARVFFAGHIITVFDLVEVSLRCLLVHSQDSLPRAPRPVDLLICLSHEQTGSPQ